MPTLYYKATLGPEAPCPQPHQPVRADLPGHRPALDQRPAGAGEQSTRLGDITNPATGQVIRRVSLANAQDVDAAVAAAEAAFPAWHATTPLRRARILD